jgi:RNA polymerase sigma-70 factor (ECF subfamily)
MMSFELAIRALDAALAAPATEADPRENTEDPEVGWIRRARGGDPEAFGRLVDRYRDRALETALRIVGSREEAEEVAQDSFVRAWRFLGGFRGECRFSTWLYRIVTRQALDAARKLQRIRAHEKESERIEALPRPAAPPDSHLRRLERALAELTPVQRAVVTLHYLRDETVEETARILEMPPGTVKSHLHRSRSALRRAWMRQEKRSGLHEL